MYTWAEKYVKYERPQKRAAQGMTRESHHMLAGSNYAAGGKDIILPQFKEISWTIHNFVIFLVYLIWPVSSLFSSLFLFI